MLQQALRAMGFDLDREVSKLIARAKDQFESLNARTIRDLKSYTRQLAESAMLLAAGIAFCVIAAGLGMALLFLFMEERYGTHAALGAIGGIAAVLAAILLFAAFRRASREDEPAAVTAPSSAPIQEPYVEPMPPPVRPSAYLATLIPPPAPGAPLTEILLHQAKTRGAEAADEAIGQAEKVIREGSRPALITTLALTALVGLYFGRQKRF